MDSHIGQTLDIKKKKEKIGREKSIWEVRESTRRL